MKIATYNVNVSPGGGPGRCKSMQSAVFGSRELAILDSWFVIPDF
jgi:hypothetical protein